MLKRLSVLVLASLFASSSALATCPTQCADIVWGDVNGDSAVDIADLSVLAGYFSGSGAAVCDGSDMNRDGAVDIADLSWLGAWLSGNGPAPLNQFCCDQCTSLMAGDANEDGVVDIADAIAISNYAGGGGICLAAADVSLDGEIDTSPDAKMVLDYLFSGGPALYLECHP